MFDWFNVSVFIVDYHLFVFFTLVILLLLLQLFSMISTRI